MCFAQAEMNYHRARTESQIFVLGVTGRPLPVTARFLFPPRFFASLFFIAPRHVQGIGEKERPGQLCQLVFHPLKLSGQSQ